MCTGILGEFFLLIFFFIYGGIVLPYRIVHSSSNDSFFIKKTQVSLKQTNPPYRPVGYSFIVFAPS